MIKHKWIGAITALLMAAVLLFLAGAYLFPSALTAFSGSSELPYVSAMDKTEILDVQIIADENDWADMLDNAAAEEYIPAAVIINGTKIENVGIRPKGNSSLRTVAQDDTTDRYSFKIEFDHYISGQTWMGLDKIALNNMQGDSTYMKEYLSYDLMDYIGVESPLYTFSNISVNGENWGFYLAVEVLEDSYAKRVYGNDHSKLYKPESMDMGDSGQRNEGNAGGNMQRPEQLPMQENTPPENLPADTPQRGPGGFGRQSGGAALQYTDDQISSYSTIFEGAVFDTSDKDFMNVINALKKLNAGEDLESAVDVEATLKYFAAHTVLVNLDSYVSNMSHNYYLYEENGQLTMLPWDFNLAFGGFQSGSASSVVNFPIDTPVSNVSLEERPMIGKLLEVPEYLELYHSYLTEIVDGYFNSGLFEQTIDSLDALISSYVEADPTAFYDYTSYKSGIAELKKLGLLRAQSVEGQLNGTIPSTTEGQNAAPDALVDASDINLSLLGTMGGGFGGRQGERTPKNAEGETSTPSEAKRGGDFKRGGRPPGSMQENIPENTPGNALENTPKNTLENAPGNTLENTTGNTLKNTTENTLENSPEGMNSRFPQENQPLTAEASTAASGFDKTAWILLGSCTALLSAGLLFVIFFHRRRPI
ncbi:MAG: CotH kinase family protein [Lacrimispora sp.]|uniref:CotH kinase family protein n=1 Tax=Lacrimispora sp. TaxID=2719234 RepID=UPI0039E5A230